MMLFVCCEAVESNIVKPETSCRFGDPSPSDSGPAHAIKLGSMNLKMAGIRAKFLIYLK